MQIHFTDAEVKRLTKRLKLPAGKSQADYFENVIAGRSLILTLNAGGRHAWSVLFYEHGRPKRRKIGYYGHSDAKFPELSVKEARQKAIDFDVPNYLAQGKVGSFKQVAEAWLKRHVKGRLRSEREIERHLRVYVYPHWADRPFTEIRRVDVNQLLDAIEDERGQRQADTVLTSIRSLMVWHESRSDDYRSPIVKGMKRDKRLPAARSRDRVLNDDEIRGLWKALDEVDQTFAGILRLCLLTGQRRDKVVTMRWEDLDLETGTWKIPSAEREKGNAGTMVLPAMALEILKRRPAINDSPFIFAASFSRTKKWPVFSAWSQRKAELDKILPIAPWTIHDLRRTSRSLMARIGVDKDIAERVLGHKQQGVVMIYDRHKPEREMAAAVAQLAAALERIIHGGDAGAEAAEAA